MILSKPTTCFGCSRALVEGNYVEGADVGDEWSYLCYGCYQKVRRPGRQLLDTIEAILFYQCDPDVGGPDDPLDHEDYHDLKRLGLWPRA